VFPLPPFPMWPAFPASEYYGGSAPSRTDRSTVDPTRSPHWRCGTEQTRNGSRVHCCSLSGGGAQLCPCGIAMATPQHFTMASR